MKNISKIACIFIGFACLTACVEDYSEDYYSSNTPAGAYYGSEMTAGYNQDYQARTRPKDGYSSSQTAPAQGTPRSSGQPSSQQGGYY